MVGEERGWRKKRVVDRKVIKEKTKSTILKFLEYSTVRRLYIIASGYARS